MGVQTRTVDMWSDIPTLLAAAHELKSPLVLIRQLSLQLESGAEHETIERIRFTAERSLRLVEGLTRVARLEDTLFENEPIHIASLYDEVVHDVMPLAKALGQTVELSLPSRPLTIIGNRSLLYSVMLGLCDNALTHNDVARPIELSAKKRSDRVSIGVRDHGPRTASLGEVRRRLGTAPQTLSSRPRSSGLGLLIAEQFARHMDATLSLTRHRGDGATFSLSLPASLQMSLFADSP